jgi:hypothetical protein
MASGTWSNLIAAAGLTVSAATFVFLIVQVSLARKQLRQAQSSFEAEQLRSKRQSTLEFLAATIERKQEFVKVLPHELDFRRVSRFKNKLRKSEDARRLLWNYLNYFEAIATGVNSGIYDLETVSRIDGSTIVRVFETYKDIISNSRRVDDNPGMYIEMEILAVQLRKAKAAQVAKLQDSLDSVLNS